MDIASFITASALAACMHATPGVVVSTRAIPPSATEIRVRLDDGRTIRFVQDYTCSGTGGKGCLEAGTRVRLYECLGGVAAEPEADSKEGGQ